MSDLAAQPACAPNTCVSCSYTNLKQVLECSAQYRACVTKDLKNSIIYVEISSCSSASACKAENPQAERRVFCSALQHANRVLQQANKCQNILSTYLHGDGIVLEERDASNNLLFLPPQMFLSSLGFKAIAWLMIWKQEPGKCTLKTGLWNSLEASMRHCRRERGRQHWTKLVSY